MQRGTVLNIRGFKVLDFIKNNKILIILVLFFIIGIVSGTIAIKNFSALKTYSEEYFENFIKERTNAKFFSTVLSSFGSAMMLMLLFFASGASMLGIVIVPLSAGLRGFLYGITTSYIYSEYGVKGIAFNTVIIIPSAAILIIAYLLAAKESIKFSIVIAKLTMPKSMPMNLSTDFKNYCGRYLMILIVVLISAVLDALMSYSFMTYFKL